MGVSDVDDLIFELELLLHNLMVYTKPERHGVVKNPARELELLDVIQGSGEVPESKMAYFISHAKVDASDPRDVLSVTNAEHPLNEFDDFIFVYHLR